MRRFPQISFLHSIALLLFLVTGTNETWADDLSASTTVTGYESYNKIFFNFKNNDPSLLPTSGDVRYRKSYGLWNFASGRRSVTVPIPVTNGDLLVLQDYTDSNTTINRGTENTSLSSSTGFHCFEISEDADDVTFSIDRGKCIVAALLLSQKYFYMVNASDGTNTLKTLAMGKVTAGESVTIAYPQYILNGNTLYNIANNGTGDYYRKTITPNTASYIETLNYTNGTVSNVVYYQEAEDVSGVTVVDYTNRASYGRVAHTEGVANYFNATTLSTGAYKIYLRGLNGNNDPRQASFKVGDTEVFNFSITQGTNQLGNSSVFQATSSLPLSLSCGRGTAGIDWYYIQAIFAYKESGSTIDVSRSNYRPDLYLPDDDEATYTFTSDNEGVATVDWNGIDAHHNGTATITAKKTINGVEYYTTHTVTVTGEAEATTTFSYDEVNKIETYTITGDGTLPEYDDCTTINIGYGSTDEIQVASGTLAHCTDAYGYWHAHLSGNSTGIPDMGTYYILRPKLGYHGKITINAYVGDDNGTRNGIRLVREDGTVQERITSISSTTTDYSFNLELIDGQTYYLMAETGAMSGAMNSAYSNLQLHSITFTQSNYVNTSAVIEIPSGGNYTITNGTGMTSPSYSIVNEFGELANTGITINSSTGQLSGITKGGALRIGLTKDGYTAYHLLTVAYPATEYPGHLWDFNIEGEPMTTAALLRTVPVPPNTALGNSGDTWAALFKVNDGTYTRAPEWRLNRAINGDNVLVVPETAGLLFSTIYQGFYMRNDDDAYRHVGIHSDGASFTIPFLKVGNIVELNWKHDAGNSGSVFSATNLKDLRNKTIDETFLITESAYRTQFNHPGRYSFIVAADGDVTFTLKDAGYTDILSIRIYEGPYRSTMHNIDLSGGDAAPTEALLDNIGNTEAPNYKQFTYNYCNPLYSTATGPAMYVIKGYEAGKGFNRGVDADRKGDADPNNLNWYVDPDAYPVDDAAELARLINLRKNLVGLKVENHPWKSNNNAYNNGYIAATSGWGKVTVRMNNYTNDMKYVIGYTPDYTITFGSAPHQEYPYTWDFTHISAQQVTGLATNAYNSIRNDWYTTNWDTSAEGVSLLNVDNSGDTGSQYVPGAILVTTERALSKFKGAPSADVYALDELDGLGVNGQIAIHGDLTQNASRTRATIVELLKYNLDDGFTATTELTAGSGTVYFGADKYVTIDHSQVDATNDYSYQLDGGGSKYIRLTLPYGVNFEAGNTITIKAYSNKANGGVTLHQSAETGSEETAYLKATLTLANKYAEETLTYTVSAGDGIEGQHQVWIYRANGNTTFVTEMSVKGTSDEIPVINKMLYAASETTLTIPDLNADGKQDWIYVSASAAPTAVTNATIVTSGTDGPDANQSPELEDSNAKVYKYKVDGNSKINAYLTFGAGTKIYKIGVTHILKDIHSVGGTGWATEIRKHEIDHELTGYFTKNDVNAYVVTYDSYDMKTATVALTPINEDGYVPTKTGVVMKLDNVSGLTDANNGMNVPLFYPSYTRPQTTTPVDFPTNNRMYNVDEGIENNNRNGNEQYFNLNESGVNYTKFVLTNVHWTYTVNNNSGSWSGPIENQDAAGFYRLHIWGDERDIMPAHNAFMLVETDNLPRALWEQYPSSARQNTIGIRSDGDNGVTDINEVKVINSEGYIADDIDEAPWFTLSGMKLSTRPTQPGLYIYNNRKVVIK